MHRLLIAITAMIACHFVLTGVVWRGAPDSPFPAVEKQVAAGDGATIHIWSDSTGNSHADPREWPYLFADWLARQRSDATVAIWPWLVDRSDYADKPWQISEGLGPTIAIHNFAVSGASFRRAYEGDVWGRAFVGTPDLLIINMGLNLAWMEDPEEIAREFSTAVERYRANFPDTQIAVIKQNPFTNRDTMDRVYAAIDIVAQERDLSVIDVGSAFKSSSSMIDLYVANDPTHPTSRARTCTLTC